VPILDFEASAAKGPDSRKPLKLVLGTGFLVGALALGSTLAASINLSGAGPIEFGQGFVAATACDPDITITPFSSFINATGGGEHKLTSIRLSGIDSSDGACEGKTFRIRAYGDGPEPLDLFQWEEREYLEDNQYSSWTVTESPFDYVDITRISSVPYFLWTSDGTDDDDVNEIDNSPLTETAFTLNLVSGEPLIRRTPLQLADDVKKITVESRDAGDAAPVSYSVGDVGPGGGIIFYVNTEGFNCGQDFNDTGSPTGGKCNYLEAAPQGWDTSGCATPYNGSPDPMMGDEGYTTDGSVDPCYAMDSLEAGVQTANLSAIGAGYLNSRTIKTASNGEAASVSLGYISANGKDDWYLPSALEFIELVRTHDRGDILVGVTIEDIYFTSTYVPYGNGPGQMNFPWYVYGDQIDNYSVLDLGLSGLSYQADPNTYYVRPIRAF